MANNNIVNSNPWKGLNFYVEGEVLYGRDTEIDSLSQYIINNTQTVLFGKSGIGKSSILNAGVFPIARRHGLLPVGIRLDHTSKISYLKQIKIAIEQKGVDVHEIVPVVDENTESLWEYMHRNVFYDKNGKKAQLLLVLDQFEEIFTLQQDEKKKRKFFDELASLLNNITPLFIVNADKKTDMPVVDDIQETNNSLEELDIEIDLDEVQNEPSFHYLQNVDYHIVFTLREDFLSYLERYTAYIPSMKLNRYALMPLNEEQAADIIMKPRKGLVDKDVATLIIQKITRKTDFQLDGIPEIDVDAAALSLYLSRLFIKKGEDCPIITADLVNHFSDDIIKDFYEESIANIPSEEIERIEDLLLTYDGRRNNVSRKDLIHNGISNQSIKTLVENRKLLREFSYQDDIRVEFMHDILCDVIKARRAQRDSVKKLKRSIRITSIATIVSALAILALIYVGYKYLTKPTTVIEDKFVDVMLVFNPDETLTDDPWEADVNINALNDSIMTLLNTSKLVEGVLHIKGPGSDTIMVRMLMDDVERPFDITVNSRTGGLCAERKDRVRLEKPNADSLRSVTWAVTLTRDPQAMYTLMGNIATKYGTPIYDAFVVLGDKIARTDNMGNYAFRMNDSTELMGSVLHVFKGEYESEAINGEDILKYMHAKQIDSYNITLKTRPEYDSLYINELTITDKIVNRTGHLNAKDSSFINTYFGNDYFIKHTKATSPDTVFYYVFRQVRNKNSEMQGRVFGYYLHKKNKKPFTGYVEEIERDGKLRRWKISLTAHDSIFNKERITGIIHGDYIDLKY